MLLKRSFAVFLIAVFLVPVLWNGNNLAATAATKTPSFSEAKIIIAGIGEIHQLIINNQITKSKYAWSSSNKTVAKVSKKGLVTSVGGGTATIKCKVTYPSKKSKMLSCKVTVTVPATAINISDQPLNNANAYELTVGGTVDLNAVITPSNSTDQAYWYIDKDNVLSTPDCISLDSNNAGIVTGLKPGKSTVRVKAAVSATAESDIDDTIIIEVVAQTASVKSADITNSNQITVVFDNPIQQNTVINADGTLSSNITISLCTDNKKVVAADPGKLTAALSADMKTLTITSANLLKGIYGIDFSSKILTTGNVALEASYNQMTYSDTVAPDYAGTTYDESGMIATISFTEPMNFTNFKVSGAKLVNASSQTFSATTLAVLNNAMNYTISTDKKSVTINLSTIASTDYGKLFSVVLSGITDLAGNYPANACITAYLMVDTTQKPQARPVSEIRTGYNTITVTFDRSINPKFPGYLQVGSNGPILGAVSTTNTNQVVYTLTPSQALLTGVNTIYLWEWNSYNVLPTDTFAYSQHPYSVNFTTDTIAPVLTSYSFDPDTGVLTLSYNEEVNLAAASGTIYSTLTTQNEDVRPGINITYKQIADTDPNVIHLQLSNITVSGYYAFTLNTGFVTDNFLNMAAGKDLTITNIGSNSTVLPNPTAIQQSTTNLSQIYVYFANKLDKASAETVSNYTITGVTILSASLSENSSTTGACVMLTVADGSIGVTVDRPITINGVMGYNGSYTAIANYQTTATFKENVKPYLLSTTFDSSSKNIIKLTFSEPIQGSLTVTVTQNINGVSTAINNTVLINGNVAYISLTPIPVSQSYLTIIPTSNTITDISGNTCVPFPSAAALATY